MHQFSVALSLTEIGGGSINEKELSPVHQEQINHLKNLSRQMRMDWLPKPASIQSAPPPKNCDTPARRRRDHLLLDPNMKYVVSRATGKMHDRDCPNAAKIQPDDFDMLPSLPRTVAAGCGCIPKAIIRQGLAPQESKWIDAYVRIFNALGAKYRLLYTLFIENEAKLRGVQKDHFYIQVKDDTWKIVLATGQERKCELYHNNYYILEDGSRFICTDFHRQIKGTMLLSAAVQMMCEYDWSRHYQTILERQHNRERNQLQQELKRVRFYALHKKRLLSRQYWVVDLGGHLEEEAQTQKIPFRVLRVQRYPGTGCVRILCKVRPWNEKCFIKLLSGLKNYYATNRCWEIRDFLLDTHRSIEKQL